jgi:hypothetical protein
LDSPAQLAAKKLAWQLETQTSVEMEVTTTIIPLGKAANRPRDFTSTVEHYIETSAGQRFLDTRGMKDGVVVNHYAHYGEGGTFTDVNYNPKEVEKQLSVYKTNHFFMEDLSDRRQVPPPIFYLYVGRKSLHEALPMADYLGTSECLGKECDLFLFKQVRWVVPQDQVFTLDKKTSIPIRVENYRDEASRDKKLPLLTWTAKSLDRVQGYDVPIKSSVVQYGSDGSPDFQWDIEVNKIKFNESYPESTFRPILQPGVVVLDGAVNKAYKTPEAAPTKTEGSPSTSAVVQPVQATPPGNWSTTYSAASLIFGTALVIAGVFAWWRRR